MWTAHFDNFCARRNLMVTHISLPQNLAAATSYRDNGEHFFDIHTPDSNLVTMKQWQSFLPFFDESNLLRLDVSGFPRSLTHRRLDDLDVNWIPDDDLDLTESQVSSLLDALAYGYDPIETVSRDQALCILQNKKIGIMGDSISRYFTFTFNYFLRTGEIPPDFDITLSDVSWGYVNGNENNGWNGVAAGVDYYDFGDLWNDEDSDFRSTRTQHRQRFETAHDSDISTTFWFIQDTWYPVLEDLIDSTINNDYDILIVNSGWWELTDSDTLDPDLTAVDCSLDGMYKNEDCLSGYESDLRNFINALLPTFSLDNKAIVWRNSNCCGDSFTQSEINDGDMRKGALAAHALNVITNDVMAELGIQTFDPSGTGNIANVGIKNQDIIDKRTFDGSHPRVWVYYAWIQVILNKIAKQLGNYDACLGTTEIPTPAPSTAAPSFKPTYSMVPTSAECSNQVRDGSETDIDCGGAQCDACEIGLSCSIDSDCITQFCLVDICVTAPTFAPTPAPSISPTLAPITPTLKPTISLSPTPAPVPQPVGGGGDDDEECDDSDYGNNCNTRPEGEVTFTVGNTTFTCPLGVTAKDGVRYARRGSEINRLFGENCITTGMRLMLSLLVSIIIVFIVAWMQWYEAYRHLKNLSPPDQLPTPTKLASFCACLFGRASSNQYQNYANIGNGMNNIGGSDGPKKDIQMRDFVTSGEGKQAGGGDHGDLERELSGSALMVLKQMEAQESKRRDQKSTGTGANKATANMNTAELDPINEEEGSDASTPHTGGGKVASNKPQQDGYKHSAGSQQLNASRNYHTGGRHQTSSSYHRAGGSRYARTTETRISQRLNSTFSASVPLDQRASRYSEPFSNYSSSQHGSYAAGRPSSVAFSLYDGGDSDDSDDEVPDEGTELPYEDTAGANPEDLEQHSALIDARKRHIEATKALGAAGVCIELALLLIACVIGEHRMPAGYLPAGTRLLTENIDLWTFIMLSLAFISLLKFKIIDDGSGKPIRPDELLFLSRAQASEFKGWMQIAFVAYHYTNAQDIYVPVRWFVSAYLWLTGFGNATYIWQTADFSLARFLQTMWRINFLSVLLSLCTGTPWIDYYFVALATVHYILIFLAMGVARILSSIIGLPQAVKKKSSAHIIERCLGLVILAIFVIAIWYKGQPDNFGSGSLVYRAIFQSWMRKISYHMENYFWTRTKMDYLSGLSGAVFALGYPYIKEVWPQIPIHRRILYFCIACIGLIISIVVSDLKKFCCRNGLEYRRVNAYISTLWIPAYFILRNLTPSLANRVAIPMEWIGMHSLEFYLLQFHVFLTRRSQLILYIIPKENWAYTNMAITGFIYWLLVGRALEITNVMRNIAWKSSKFQFAIAATWVLLFYIIFAAAFTDREDNTCSPASWGVWTIFTLIAMGLLIKWTLIPSPL